MSINIDDLLNKVENNGTTANGKLTASEFNRLAGAVKELQDAGNSNGSTTVQQVQANWNETSTTSPSFIKNKPSNLVQDPNYVHTDNNFTDLLKQKLESFNSEEIFTQEQADWTETDNTASSFIRNKPADLYSKPAGGIPLQDLSEEVQRAVRPFIGSSGGTTTVATTLTLDDLRGSGEMVGYYLDSINRVALPYANCIITKPIYLHAGDEVTCSSGGTNLVIFAKSPSGDIAYGMTGYTLISGTANSYSGTVEVDGWYVFSGRINKTDGTNLVVSITKYTEVAGGSGGSVIDEINGRLDALESGQETAVPVSGGSGYALSVGVNSIIADVPASPWFDADSSLALGYGNYLDNKIDSVPDGDSFIFISDCHYPGNKKKSAQLIDYVRRRLGIKTIIHGGDVIDGGRPKGVEAQEWRDFNKDFVFRIGGDFKQVCGDHDHNGGAPTEQYLPYQFIQRMMNGYNLKELTVDTFYDEQIAQVAAANGWTEDEKKEYEAWKRMHYWFDDMTINTRFIVLHTGWSGDAGLAVDKLGTNSLSEANALYLQMDFLYRALITCPAGMNVVVCGHNVIGNRARVYASPSGNVYRYDVNDVIFKGSWRQVAKMLECYKKKEAVTLGYRDWTMDAKATKVFDFATAATPNLVFCMGGDVHWDVIGKYSIATDLKPLATATSVENIIVTEGTVLRDEIPHILTMTDGGDRGYRGVIADPSTTEGYNDETDSVVICSPNTEGTLDSQAFDIVTMTKDALYLTRIGSGSDRVVRFVDNQD